MYCIRTTDRQSTQGKPFVTLEPASWTVFQRAEFPFLQSSKSCLFRLFHGIQSKALLYQDQERRLPNYAGIIWYQRLLNYSEVEAYLCEWHYIVLCFAPSPFSRFSRQNGAGLRALSVVVWQKCRILSRPLARCRFLRPLLIGAGALSCKFKAVEYVNTVKWFNFLSFCSIQTAVCFSWSDECNLSGLLNSWLVAPDFQNLHDGDKLVSGNGGVPTYLRKKWLRRCFFYKSTKLLSTGRMTKNQWNQA